MSQLTTDLGLWCLQSETTNNSTVFVDSVSQDTIIPYGNVYHSTNQALFGNSSIYIGPTASDYIKLPYINNKAIDFQVYLTSNNKNIIFGDAYHYLSYDANNNINFSYFNITGTMPVSPVNSNDIIVIAPENHNFELNQWNHIYIYVDKNESSVPFYGTINGTLYDTTMYIVATTLKIAINGVLYTSSGIRQFLSSYSSSNPGLSLGSFDGYVEEIRQSNDNMTTDFTPLEVPYSEYIPPAVYSISGTTSIQGVLTSGITVRAYNRSTGLLEGEAISDESGSYSITNIPNNDLKYLICLDKNSPIIYNSLIRDRIELT